MLASPAVQPLSGLLVVDLTRYLPGAYASRELLRLGARVVRLEAPEGDPMRWTAPAWEAALNAGKESVAVDLPRFDVGDTEGGAVMRRGVPVRRVGGHLVTTVFDLLAAQLGVARDGLPGDWPSGLDRPLLQVQPHALPGL